ncbi:protein sidekick-like [Amphibalanus amphitrite]|uniref:protein sidekick-like n=1 Tax=Amphibalanus amphitrite TaxID=1232801 RepID=UPI001C91B0A2|nr:protein sidekick-like [Amphibalanus amphitrite]
MEALAEGFSIEHRSSRRSTMKRNTISRRSAVAAAVPPRPMPASVAYNSDNESKYDENPDDSSLSEKPSEVSSTDSQGDDDEDELYYQSGARSMVGHYTNVNDVCRQSWKRQRPTPSRQVPSGPVRTAATAGPVPGAIGGGGLRNYASHTDSEQEGSAVMSLNGAEVVVNNRAGSRAPLGSGANGFSSFV